MMVEVMMVEVEVICLITVAARCDRSSALFVQLNSGP